MTRRHHRILRDIEKYRAALMAFQAQISATEPTADAARYIAASTSQTDNLQPRITRAEILKRQLKSLK